VRRALGEGSSIEGDPVEVTLPTDTAIDVNQVSRGSWGDAVGLESLGGELLEGVNVRGAAGFESWLLAERRRVAAVTEAILHEGALGSLSIGDLATALGFAERAARMAPLDENSHALVIRIHRRMGNPRAAREHYDLLAQRLHTDLGIEPGHVVESAMREEDGRAHEPSSRIAIHAIMEAGAAAVAAGAGAAGAESLRMAVHLADATEDDGLRIASRLVLGEAMIHSIRGFDEEGLEALHAADLIAASVGDDEALSEVRSELGYVDFLRGRYDRAEFWLREALRRAADGSSTAAKAEIYLGSVDSDRADYPQALAALSAGTAVARAIGDGRRMAFALSMMGRIHLLRGRLDQAADDLAASIDVAEGEHWLAFLPWPQALLGEVELARGRVEAASSLLEQAFARACQLGDPCWEGLSGRGLGLLAAAQGDIDVAFERLADARVRNNRLPDTYVWLDAHILDAQCALGQRHGHPSTSAWIDAMRTLASRTDMREMTVRSLLHGAALGSEQDAEGAALMGAAIDNPLLAAQIAAVRASGQPITLPHVRA
jgi:DNA-binding SARP family transcriptional activator